MADDTLGSSQQNVQLISPAVSFNSQPATADDSPLDFSIKRNQVTPMTSSSLSVVPPHPAVVFPQLMDPAVASALSAVGLLPRGAAPCRPGDVSDKVRAYVQTKIAEEQRRLLQTASLSSSTAVDSSVERTSTSPVRSSPTSTTTPSLTFDALPPHRWPATAMPPPPPSAVQTAAASRKRDFGCTDTSSSKDTHYWERRRKNNEAAKRSRDARRAKEEEVALRASMLEQENRQLRVELTAFRLEVARLSELLCRQVTNTTTGTAVGATSPINIQQHRPPDNNPR